MSEHICTGECGICDGSCFPEVKEFNNMVSNIFEKETKSKPTLKELCSKDGHLKSELMSKLLKLNPQINENSKYTNPHLYTDITNWYNELKNL